MDLALSVYIGVAHEKTSQTLNKQADSFKRNVQSVVGVVSSTAGELQTTAHGMVKTAEQTARQSEVMAGAAEKAAGNVNPWRRRPRNCRPPSPKSAGRLSSRPTFQGSAVREAERTNALVWGLAEAAGRIDAVVKLINNIANQTNLLALNATIEAARAGDAGKSFAVVANEVKNLANQTAKATGEIFAQIGSVQAATRDAVTAIEGIGGTIGKINEIAAAIAAAVEQQSAATQEIARNVQHAAAGTSAVTETIGDVTRAAGEIGHAATIILSAAEQFSQQSSHLKNAIDSFLGDIRRL